jgi:outer membrane lipoprotein-sorting protein
MRTRNVTVAGAALQAVFACAIFSGPAYAQDASEILKKVKDTYAAMKSYSDTGVVLDFPDAASTNPILAKLSRHTFTTDFSRSPRGFIHNYRACDTCQYVIWADPDAFHTWNKTTGDRYDYPNPNNTGAMSGSPATTKIPTLLYSKARLLSDFNYYDDVALDGSEAIDGHRCYRLVGRAHDEYAATGRVVNVRKMTVWVDTESFLIRRISQDSGPTAGGGPHRVEQVTYQPQANPNLDQSKFKFIPPEK